MSFFVQGEKIMLKKDNTWVADGVEITHEQTRKLFSRSIHWDALEHRYFLKIGFEKLYIDVEDTPYFVIEIDRRRTSWLKRSFDITARLSDGSEAAIAGPRLSYNRGSLYLDLPGGMKARFLSAPYYDLLRDLQEDEQSYFLLIGDKRVELAKKGSSDELSSAGSA